MNVALPAGIKDARWLRAFHAIVPPLLAQFRPQILVSQHGADTHRLDPLARLELSIDGQRAAHAAVHALAHDLAGGRWLLTGGGGYELVRVVPRSWTHLLAEAAGQPIDPGTPTPARWRDYVAQRTGVTAPEKMTEGHPRCSSRSSPATTRPSGRPGDHRHPQRGLPPARADRRDRQPQTVRDSPVIKYVYEIDYPPRGKDKYLEWVRSVADALQAPAELRRLASYDDVYSATPRRVVEFTFDSPRDAARYVFDTKGDRADLAKGELPTHSANIRIKVLALRDDYIKATVAETAVKRRQPGLLTSRWP